MSLTRRSCNFCFNDVFASSEVKVWQERTKELCSREGRVLTIMGRHRNLFDATSSGGSSSRSTSTLTIGDESSDSDNMSYASNESSPSVKDDGLPDDVPGLNKYLFNLKKSKRASFKSLNEQELADLDGSIEYVEDKIKRINDSRRRKDHALRAAINTPIQGSAADIVMMAMIKLYRSERLKEIGYRLLLQIHDEVILEGPEQFREEVSISNSNYLWYTVFQKLTDYN